LALAVLNGAAAAEIIKVSLLQKKQAPFQAKKNIFSITDFPSAAPAARQPEKKPEEEAPPPRDIAAELRQSVIYEGFVTRNGKKMALISTGGESFTAEEGDVLLDKLKILSITPTSVTIEFEGAPYQISLKGAENGPN